jgi:hypothetical protein
MRLECLGTRSYLRLIAQSEGPALQALKAETAYLTNLVALFIVFFGFMVLLKIVGIEPLTLFRSINPQWTQETHEPYCLSFYHPQPMRIFQFFPYHLDKHHG